MGDDNEIRDIVRRESEQFLEAARKATHNTGAVYNLEEEFGKTRHNKSLVVWGVTLLTIAALGAAAFSATALIKRQTAASPVDVQAFQDLNLKDLLDRAKRDEADLEQAKAELVRAQNELQVSLDSVERERLAAIDAIKARGLKASDEKAALAQAATDYAAKKKATQARYASTIAARQADVKTYQEKVDSYDMRLSEQNKKQQEALDNQSKLFALEKARLTDSYTGQIQDLKDSIKREEAALKRQREELASSLTAKWNPNFEDERSKSLLSSWKDEASPRTIPTTALPAGLFSSGSATKADTAAADVSIQNLLFLSSQLRSIPYLNSVPPALARMEYEARLSFTTIRLALQKAGGAIEDRDRQIADLKARLQAAETSLDHYRWAASQYVLENREGGYIIDARNADDLLIEMNPAVPVANGMTGTVVRPGDKAIANLAFFMKNGQVHARVVHIEPGETLKAFDSIIVFLSSVSSDTPGN